MCTRQNICLGARKHAIVLYPRLLLFWKEWINCCPPPMQLNACCTDSWHHRMSMLSRVHQSCEPGCCTKHTPCSFVYSWMLRSVLRCSEAPTSPLFDNTPLNWAQSTHDRHMHILQFLWLLICVKMCWPGSPPYGYCILTSEPNLWQWPDEPGILLSPPWSFSIGQPDFIFQVGWFSFEISIHHKGTGVYPLASSVIFIG